MLSHITTDLHQVYLEEVFTPQLGKPGASTPVKPKSSSDIDGDGDVDSFEKNVRQVIYDVRHIMKEKKVPAEQAFKLRTSKTNYSAEVIETAKKKLGVIGGSSISVSEESTGRMVKVTINYKNGTIDRRNVPYTEVSQLRSKPTISSVEISSNRVFYPGAGEKYEKKYGKGGKNTVGDMDRDGTKEPNRHEYAGVRDTAIKKSMSTKKKLKGYGVSEGFSNWREDLCEVSDEFKSKKKSEIKEDPAINNKVVINPEFAEKVEILGGTIVESFELNEEYISEAVDIATEFFYNYGLNENGVDIVIEELGEEKFAEFVFDLSEEYFLIEARSAKKRKGGKSYEEIKAEIDAKESARKKVTADKTKKAVETAKQTQAPSPNKGKKPVRDAIARGIFGIAKAYQKGMERHRAATQTAGKVLKVAGKGAKEFAGGVKSGVEATVDATKKIKKAVVNEDYYDLKSKSVKPGKPGEEQRETIKTLASIARTKKKTRTPARRRSNTFKPSSPEEAEANKKSWEDYWSSAAKGYKEEYDLLEKSESEQQQKLFGLALSVKRGETPRSEVSAEVLKIVDTMSEKKIRDFAKTPHSDVPKKKVNEAIARVRPNRRTDTESRQRETRKIQTDNAREKIGEDFDTQTITPQELNLRRQEANIKDRIAELRKKAVRKQQPSNIQTKNSDMTSKSMTNPK